jgi:hypothetical protein
MGNYLRGYYLLPFGVNEEGGCEDMKESNYFQIPSLKAQQTLVRDLKIVGYRMTNRVNCGLLSNLCRVASKQVKVTRQKVPQPNLTTASF